MLVLGRVHNYFIMVVDSNRQDWVKVSNVTQLLRGVTKNLPETNIPPIRRPVPRKETHLNQPQGFRWGAVSFREGKRVAIYRRRKRCRCRPRWYKYRDHVGIPTQKGRGRDRAWMVIQPGIPAQKVHKWSVFSSGYPLKDSTPFQI